MKIDSLKRFFLYCTLTKNEYALIGPMVWLRNRRTLRITSLLSALMGLVFYVVNKLTASGVLLPYLLLFCASAAIYLLLHLMRRAEASEWGSMALCYAQMLLVCAYAGVLSIQQSNYAVPATSIIVFIALLPLSIDDRPVRMYAVMLLESAAYLLLSRAMKSPGAFSLDCLNTVTFCVVGMVLYSVICVRNVREIYQGVKVERIQQSVISSLAEVVEERDERTGDHIRRTRDYVSGLVALMRRKSKYADLTDDFCNNVVLAAPMHDIGKIRIPDAILNKPGKLTDEEYGVMKKHSSYGAEIIRKTMKDIEEDAYFQIACNMAKHHHERFDGAGYPDGLKGEDIPLEARIMALADVYDALVSERVYKKALPKEQARQILLDGAGTQFDPDLVPLFLETVQ